MPTAYYRLTRAEVIERTVRRIVFAEDVMRNDISDLLTRFNVEFGLIDNEPSRESSMQMCRHTCLQMGDQIADLREPIRKSEVADGGIIYDGHQLYRLPSEWEKWLSHPSERSPRRHLTGPSRDPKTHQWKRGPKNVDDLYFALVFVEAAFDIKLEEMMADENVGTPTTSFSVW